MNIKELEKYKYKKLGKTIKDLNNNFNDGFIMKSIRILLAFIVMFDVFRQIQKIAIHYLAKSKTNLLVLKKNKDTLIDIVVLVKIILAMAIFYFSWYEYKVIKYFILYLAVTSFISIPNAILQYKIRSEPTSYMRATVLGLFNYVELVLHFSSLYLAFRCLEYIDNNNIVDYAVHKIDYLYFSFITVSTIGFGHVKIVEGSYGYWFVIAQAFIFLMFVLIFFNINLSRINETNK